VIAKPEPDVKLAAQPSAASRSRSGEKISTKATKPKAARKTAARA
jgi:hypothetical protein